MMDDCVDFIAQYSWLVNFKVTNFFIDRVWENAPAEWLEVFKTWSYEDLKGVPYGQIKDSWPESLKVFIAGALKYLLPRERQAYTYPGGKQDSEPCKPVSVAEIHHDIRKGMTEKKLHEVCHLASLVNAVVTDSQAEYIVDVGSGLGYLGQVLHSVYHQYVLGLEGKQSHASGAEKRSRKNYTESPYLQNRTCELYPSPESESNFKIMLSDWLSSLPPAGTQNTGSASLARTQNNGQCSISGTQDNCSTSLTGTQNDGSASFAGTQNNGSASLSGTQNNGSQTKENSGTQNATSQSMEQYEFEDRSDTSCSKDPRYSETRTCSDKYEKGDTGDHNLDYRQDDERTEFSFNSNSKNCAVQKQCHQNLRCFEESKLGEEKEEIDSMLENVQEEEVKLFSDCVTVAKNNYKEQVNSCSKDSTKSGTNSYSDFTDLGCNTVTYSIDTKHASEQGVISFSKCVSNIKNTSTEENNLFSENTKTCTRSTSGSTDLCGNIMTDLPNDITHSQTTKVLDYSKVTYLLPVCMIGLHCCGDLTPTMLKYFTKMEFIKSLCVVSCCYHRMEYREDEQRLTNFPLSSSVSQCLSRTKLLHPGFNFTPYSMRLAAQETRARWKSQSPEDHNYHMRNVAYRGILELALNDGMFTLKKTSRKMVHSDDYSSFHRYVTTVSKNIQALSKESAAEQTESFQETMKQLYDEYEEYFVYIEPITSLQFLLQPVLESLIYKDRLTWLQEQGFDGDIVPIFDEIVSPRNLALIAIKR